MQLLVALADTNDRWDGFMDGHMGGGWWWAMGLVWLVFFAAVVLIVVLLMRQGGDRGSRSAHGGAEDVLAERFARGEIDEDEFRRRRAFLHSGSSAG